MQKSIIDEEVIGIHDLVLNRKNRIFCAQVGEGGAILLRGDKSHIIHYFTDEAIEVMQKKALEMDSYN